MSVDKPQSFGQPQGQSKSEQLPRTLTEAEAKQLEMQNNRMVTEFRATKLEQECQRHWDIFYKRNETNFFKDRNWTTREFEELLGMSTGTCAGGIDDTRTMLEVGCGVGNLVFPLIENERTRDLFIYACDFSPRAIEFVKANALYSDRRMKAFQCDITDADQLLAHIRPASLDLITIIFVMSAVHPEKFGRVVANMWQVLKPGGMVLLRDYGRYDMAQLRFKAGSKIADNLYVRQDGTRSYFFTVEEVDRLFRDNGFTVQCNEYVNRRTINAKENIDVPRIFLQGKFVKSIKS